MFEESQPGWLNRAQDRQHQVLRLLAETLPATCCYPYLTKTTAVHDIVTQKIEICCVMEHCLYSTRKLESHI